MALLFSSTDILYGSLYSVKGSFSISLYSVKGSFSISCYQTKICLWILLLKELSALQLSKSKCFQTLCASVKKKLMHFVPAFFQCMPVE
jgi:hypothetical protein